MQCSTLTTPSTIPPPDWHNSPVHQITEWIGLNSPGLPASLIPSTSFSASCSWALCQLSAGRPASWVHGPVHLAVSHCGLHLFVLNEQWTNTVDYMYTFTCFCCHCQSLNGFTLLVGTPQASNHSKPRYSPWIIFVLHSILGDSKPPLLQYSIAVVCGHFIHCTAGDLTRSHHSFRPLVVLETVSHSKMVSWAAAAGWN